VAAATLEVENGLGTTLLALSAFGAFGEEFLLDVTVESILDHILGPVWEELPHHLPLSAVLAIDLNDGLVLFLRESAARALFVLFGSVTLLGAHWRDQLVVEHFGNFFPVFAQLLDIFQQQLVFLWGPELHQLLLGGQALVSQILSGVGVLGGRRHQVGRNRLVFGGLFFKFGDLVTEMQVFFLI